MRPNTIKALNNGFLSDADNQPESNASFASSERNDGAKKCRNSATAEMDPPSSEALPLSGREADEANVKTLHEEWLSLRRKSLATAFKLGSLLADLKAELKNATPKRYWEPYVRDHLRIEPRTASNYMRIAREAEGLESVGQLLKSETVSELGIREALDYLAKRGKPAEPPSGSAKSANNSETQRAPVSEKPPVMPPLKLADGSRIDMKRLNWVNGPISRCSIESWMSRVNPSSDDQDALKLEARQQRAVILIAAGLNRACGNAEASAANDLVESSFEVIRKMLRENSAG